MEDGVKFKINNNKEEWKALDIYYQTLVSMTQGYNNEVLHDDWIYQ